jgi:hypothetical protein
MGSVGRFASSRGIAVPLLSRWTQKRALPPFPPRSYRRSGVQGVGGLGRRTPESPKD